MKGEELLKVGEMQLQFKTKSGWLLIHRISKIEDNKIYYTQIMPLLIDNNNYNQETEEYSINMNEILEVKKIPEYKIEF